MVMEKSNLKNGSKLVLKTRKSEEFFLVIWLRDCSKRNETNTKFNKIKKKNQKKKKIHEKN